MEGGGQILPPPPPVHVILNPIPERGLNRPWETRTPVTGMTRMSQCGAKYLVAASVVTRVEPDGPVHDVTQRVDTHVTLQHRSGQVIIRTLRSDHSKNKTRT